MILRRFPGNGRLSRGSTQDFAYFRRQNVVVYAKSREITYTEHTAPLSIKTTLKGAETYEVDGVPVAVDEGSYLVMNRDQPYTSHICSDHEVESFCVFFRDGLEEQVSAALTSSHAELLERPAGVLAPPATFFQTLRRHGGTVSLRMGRLHRGIAEGAPSQLWLDEQFHSIIEALLQDQLQIFREAESLPCVRLATRVEIYKRLCRAKDYLESCYHEPITLSLLAEVACLSRHHFLRLFKEAFRQTPHQYLTSVRLRKALALLEQRDRPIGHVCTSVGFEDASSFARLFKRRFGRTPGAGQHDPSN